MANGIISASPLGDQTIGDAVIRQVYHTLLENKEHTTIAKRTG